MYDYTPTQSEVYEAMQTLKGLGVAKVEVHFSGGNDEGGPDDVTFLDADGNKVEGPRDPNVYQDRQWDEVTRSYGEPQWTAYVGPKWNDRRPATDEEIAASKLHGVLASPIYAEYGSFAGEFYVDGTCTWDVATAKSETHGRYESRVWEEF